MVRYWFFDFGDSYTRILFPFQPDVLPLASQKPSHSAIATDERDAVEPRSIESTLKRKPSVAKMTFEGVAYVVSVSSGFKE